MSTSGSLESALPVAGWFDSHCHLFDCEDLEVVLGHARQDGVQSLTCVGTDVATSAAAIELAKQVVNAGMRAWSTIGLHPHDAKNGTDELDALVRTALLPRGAHGFEPGSVVAIGECGLDYFYEHSPRDQQAEVFAHQIRLAHEHDLALVVHTRDAWDDTFAVLERERTPERTIIHCFTGGPAEAQRALDLGAYLSFSGIVTFKNAHALREAAMLCPLDRMLVETDAPYLAPVPHRGKKNEPAYVSLVGASIAALRSMSPGDLAMRTAENARTVFALSR